MNATTAADAPGRLPRHAARQGPTRGQRAWVFFLVSVLALATAGAVTLLTTRQILNSRIEHVDFVIPQVNSPINVDDGFVDNSINVLVLGSDSRSSGGDPTNWQYGAESSDVIMVAQLSGDRESVNIMSIPRDAWVEIPGHGQDKISDAYSYGGPAGAVETVQNLMGIRIDHFIVIDFASFEALTNALGGVTIHTADGPKRMNGKQALAFVRFRANLPGGDFDRIRRQQAWMQAILSEVFNQDTLSDVNKITAMIDIVLTYSAVDAGLNFDTMLALALEARGLRPGGVNFFSAPAEATGVVEPGGLWIATLEEDKMERISWAWQRDRVAAFLRENPGIVRTLAGEPVY